MYFSLLCIMHTVIVNGKQRVVNNKQLRLIKIVYRNDIKYVDVVETKPEIVQEQTVEVKPKKVKSKVKNLEDEPIS